MFQFIAAESSSGLLPQLLSSAILFSFLYLIHFVICIYLIIIFLHILYILFYSLLPEQLRSVAILFFILLFSISYMNNIFAYFTYFVSIYSIYSILFLFFKKGARGVSRFQSMSGAHIIIIRT